MVKGKVRLQKDLHPGRDIQPGHWDWHSLPTPLRAAHGCLPAPVLASSPSSASAPVPVPASVAAPGWSCGVVLQGLHHFWPPGDVISVSKCWFRDLVLLIWMTKSWVSPACDSSRCLLMASLSRTELPAHPTSDWHCPLGSLHPHWDSAAPHMESQQAWGWKGLHLVRVFRDSMVLLPREVTVCPGHPRPEGREKQ